ncbi:MAG: hypothetical protein ACPGVU_11055 [Limisphaerales bacterium]
MPRLLIITLMAALALSAQAAKKPKPIVKPRFDDASIPFRMAPMPAASRSITVPLAPNLHLAFDTVNCRTHTVWSGKGLHLLGPQYSRSKRPFISTNGAPVLWTMPPWSPWSDESPMGEPAPISVDYKSVETKDGHVTFRYRLLAGAKDHVEVLETPFALDDNGKAAVGRQLEVGPCSVDLWFAAHSGFEPAERIKTHVKIGPLRVIAPRHSITLVSQNLNYHEEVYSETGAEKGNHSIERKGKMATAWVKIPARKETAALIITTTHESAPEYAAPLKSDRQLKNIPAARVPGFSMASNPSFRSEALRIPKELEMLVTGMAFMPNGDLAVATWIGDIYLVHNPTGDPAKMTYTRFATGLCEPMGIAVKEGVMYVGLKNELARIIDDNKDNIADRIERVRADWTYSGHYNAFSYGPVIDRNSNFVLANAGHSGRWDARYTGWAFSIAPIKSHKLTPICDGFREPNGIGVFGPDRDIFVSDNQGNWIGACRLNHVRKGSFHGHPSGWPSKKELYGQPRDMDPPAVWFPYKLARSTTDIVEITDDGFGPFKGQLMVGDFQNAIVTRVALEKVDGEYQGAVWPFLKRFSSGVNRIVYGPDHRLYVGGCQRTWASIAPKEAAIERVSFTGKVPFEVKTVNARPDGFKLTFTEPVNPETAGDPESYDVLQYMLKYHQPYGSPEFDHNGKKDSATAIEVVGADVSQDNLSVHLRVKGWKTGYVTMVRSLDARNKAGKKLVNNTFWYTLNRLPEK